MQETNNAKQKLPDFRGSQKILEKLFGGPDTPTVEQVRSLIGVTRVDYRLDRWWWKGTPPIWFEFHGHLNVDRNRVGDLVQELADKGLDIQISSSGAIGDQLAVEVSNIPSIMR